MSVGFCGNSTCMQEVMKRKRHARSSRLASSSHIASARSLTCTPPLFPQQHRRRRAVHLDVPPQGLPSLVHRRGHGRDGVHRGRVEHERPWCVPAHPRSIHDARTSHSPADLATLCFCPKQSRSTSSTRTPRPRRRASSRRRAARSTKCSTPAVSKTTFQGKTRGVLCA